MSVSWFCSWSGQKDRSVELQKVIDEALECSICLNKVTDPIQLKCGHLFDKHCIKDWIASGKGNCPLDRQEAKEDDFKEPEDIYANLKCRITASIFDKDNSRIIRTEASIFSTWEQIKELLISQFVKESGRKEAPPFRYMTVRGSFMFCPGKTLADYQVFPDTNTLMRVHFA